MNRKQIETFVGPEWVDFFSPFMESPAMDEILGALKAAKTAGDVIYPPQDKIFRVFKETPLSSVRVIILGMDPYPAEGYANGFAFAHLSNMKKAASMVKIIDAVEKDAYGGLNFNKPAFNTELTQWVEQGVLLLNSTLTVKQDNIGVHSTIWKPFTEYFVKTMSAVKRDIIWNAWGKDAHAFMKEVDIFLNFVIYSEHPSFAARNQKDWNTDSFSKTNAIITANKLGDKIVW